MKYRNFLLDPFQEKACKAIEKGSSVVVSAATGTGKTLIADYSIHFFLQKNKKIIYTSPIKSLSNQKYQEFKSYYGKEKVGLLTGDIVINPEASVLIMTVEIYRNMLLTSDPLIKDIACVIFDEIHYINDRDRGIIWEESIIFSPNNIKILALSATIPNALEFSNWIRAIKKQNVVLVENHHRVVPLKHLFFEIHNGLLDYNSYEAKLKKFKNALFRKKVNPDNYFKNSPKYNFIDLIRELKNENHVPALFFVFSRKRTQELALNLASSVKFENVDKLKIEEIIYDELSGNDDIHELETTKDLIKVLKKGIAFHHAGLLPVLKLTVERLFSLGLIKVLFATETFSVGINMPAKTVVFDTLRKYDGINFRYLKSKEFFQMAGRAGRRGIDKKGFVIPIIDYKRVNFKYVSELMKGDIEPISSMFKLSYNTVINLARQYNASDSIKILKSSFFQFQNRKKKLKISNLFFRRLKVLEKNNYITNSGNLTPKGYFLSKIYTESLVVSEIFTSDFIMKLSAFDWFYILSMIIYEPRKNDKFYFKSNDGLYILDSLNKESFLYSYFVNKDGFLLYEFLKKWFVEEVSFVNLMEFTNMQEGTVIRLFRMTIDLILQIKKATDKEEIIERCEYILYKIEREYIKFDI